MGKMHRLTLVSFDVAGVGKYFTVTTPNRLNGNPIPRILVGQIVSRLKTFVLERCQRSPAATD
jgi:hypothetical protein